MELQPGEQVLGARLLAGGAWSPAVLLLATQRRLLTFQLGV